MESISDCKKLCVLEVVRIHVDAPTSCPEGCLTLTYPSRRMQGLPQLETLYHELGHALNSVLSRTDHQHVSGASCPGLTELAARVDLMLPLEQQLKGTLIAAYPSSSICWA